MSLVVVTRLVCRLLYAFDVRGVLSALRGDSWSVSNMQLIHKDVCVSVLFRASSTTMSSHEAWQLICSPSRSLAAQKAGQKAAQSKK